MKGKNLLAFVILLILLLAIECFLLSVIFLGTTDDFNLARAFSTWKASPSVATAQALETAKNHGRTKTIIFSGVTWSLVILDAFAVFKLTKQMRMRIKKDSAGEDVQSTYRK